MKKIIISSFIMIVLASGCGCKNKLKKEENLQKLPVTVNFEVNEDQVVDGLKIENISLITDEKGMSKFTATVTNGNKTAYNISSLKIILKDSKNKKVQTLVGYIGKELEPEQMTEINASTAADLSTVVSVKFDIVR